MNEPKPKRAVALSYEQDDLLPLVVAKAEGIGAEEILALAMEAGIPITQNEPLVDSLIKLDLMQGIPPELFDLVAELLAFAYELLGKPLVDRQE
ncbi:MAG: EscU/YscU/HrcU family type III secretion system export apparatus switch protein [Acidobacteria bacterium]|nr:EscU/YscU/HrcU family type III secretion system export apparatus switch protein [Acidobacteriota bacterium]